MSVIANRLTEYLDEQGVTYHLIQHKQDFTARQAAADTDTPPDEFAKCIVVTVEKEPILAVLPASQRLDIKRLRRYFETKDIQLLEEEKQKELFPDCELGAEPPLGNLYNMRTYVSPELIEDEEITFNAGTHSEAIRMKYADFERLAHPITLEMAEREE